MQALETLQQQAAPKQGEPVEQTDALAQLFSGVVMQDDQLLSGSIADNICCRRDPFKAKDLALRSW